MNQSTQQLLTDIVQEKGITKIIKNLIGDNCCQKCYKNCDYKLTHIISFNQKGNYKFSDREGANYVLKKFCKECCYSKASKTYIYVEC